MPRGSRRRSGSKSPKRRRGSRAARKSPRRSRSPKRSPRRFRGVEDERAYGKTSNRQTMINQFESEVMQRKPTTDHFLKLLTFHMCVNADELLKDSDKRPLLESALTALGRSINFDELKTKKEAKGIGLSYLEYMRRIGGGTDSKVGGILGGGGEGKLSTVVAKVFGKALRENMEVVVKDLMDNIKTAFKILEYLNGYKAMQDTKVIDDYKEIDKLLTKLLVGGQSGDIDYTDAVVELVSKMQKMKRLHKIIFRQIFMDERLVSDHLQSDYDTGLKFKPALPRFSDVPEFREFPPPQISLLPMGTEVLPMGTEVPTATNVTPAVQTVSDQFDTAMVQPPVTDLPVVTDSAVLSEVGTAETGTVQP